MNKKEFIVVLAITLIVVIVWGISDLIHTRSSSKDLPDIKRYLEPLDPNFDKATLDKISDLSNPAPAPSANPPSTPFPTLSPQPSPKATVSATPRSAPRATPSRTP